ncbi:MAG TPA: lanthionine synthetase LanC family protein, partial [Thermoanaerobaculia bacterium]|nr:lanthionine synthetase LanC family protein [Thermoanaerobaculia bacterium]
MSVNPLSRRDLLRLGLAAGAASSLGLPAAFAEQASKPSPAPAPSAPSSYLDAAVKAAQWIHTARVQTSQGLIWLEGPEQPEGLESSSDLYTGYAGIVLFLLELARVTGDKAYKDDAGWGADALLAS